MKNKKKTDEVPRPEKLARKQNVPKSRKLPHRRKTLQEEQFNARRGERQRHKTNFYGNNVMIMNFDSEEP